MNPRLLVIEDDPDLAALLSFAASRLQFQFDLDTTGAEWQQLMRQNRPDFIFLDMDLPRMTGFSILRQIKGDAKFSSIPVYVWSGTSDSEVVEEAKALGAESYLFKKEGFENVVNQVLKPRETLSA